jgi:hypothetical protein
MPRSLPVFFVLLSALLMGCAHNPTTAQLAQVYRTGMTRDEAAQRLAKPWRVEQRPPGGWLLHDPTAERIAAFASDYETRNKTLVQTVELYWVRSGSMGLGVEWDYLFFGPDDRLLGFQRQHVD